MLNFENLEPQATLKLAIVDDFRYLNEVSMRIF